MPPFKKDEEFEESVSILLIMRSHPFLHQSRFDEEISGYPMLSRIRGFESDTAYKVDEVGLLREECLRVQSGTEDLVALRELDKLLQICNWAQKFQLSIYLMCD